MSISFKDIINCNTAKQIITWPLKSKDNFITTTIPPITFISFMMLGNISYTLSFLLSATVLCACRINSLNNQSNQRKRENELEYKNANSDISPLKA